MPVGHIEPFCGYCKLTYPKKGVTVIVTFDVVAEAQLPLVTTAL